jgi:hypothetical protein
MVMKRRLLGIFFAGSCLVGAGILFAQDTVASKIDVFGKVSIVEGQFVKSSYTHLVNGSSSSGYTREIMPYRPWLNNEYLQMGLKAALNSHFSAIVSPQIKLWNDTWDWTTMGQNGSASNPFTQHMTASLADAEGIISYGNEDVLAFNAMIGVMPFKYNQDAKNLGEYLFRTGVHPAYIQTSFDNAFATVTGLRLNGEFLNKFSLDFLFTQETQVMPLNDWSISFLAGYKAPGLLDMGIGFQCDRLIKAAGELDHPATRSVYYTSSGNLDTLEWGGTKGMAHITFDPKGLLPSGIVDKMGKEDGKIYAEAAILGLKSFTAYKRVVASGDTSYVVDDTLNFYSDIKQRIPIMVGFNVPVFKLLDYLSIEVEWYNWPYSPSLYDYQNLVTTLARPIIPKINGTGTLYTKDDAWKYSINARKTIYGHFSIIGQIANDHTRHDAYYSSFADPEEVFLKKDQWGWWLKLQYSL